jgi:uncharacterized protein (DUF1810 family)
VIEDQDPFQLARFIGAQESQFDIALSELKAGEKRSHWIWFVFPQFAGLGRSPTAQFYGIRSLLEARAFLAHPILGVRYRQAVEALLDWTGRKAAEEILGDVDAMKLKSSLTLFEAASGDRLFATAIDTFYGSRDDATTKLLGR